jgi:hypothetical protein
MTIVSRAWGVSPPPPAQTLTCHPKADLPTDPKDHYHSSSNLSPPSQSIPPSERGECVCWEGRGQLLSQGSELILAQIPVLLI